MTLLPMTRNAALMARAGFNPEVVLAEMRKDLCVDLELAPESERGEVLHAQIVDGGGTADVRSTLKTVYHLGCTGMGNSLNEAANDWIKAAKRMASGSTHA